jgi:hypothetical protein
MKKSQIISALGLIFLISLSVYSKFFEYNSVKESTLNDFANPKEAYAMLLEGMASFQGDTVSFDLIAAVPYAIDFTNRDIVIVKKKNGGQMTFQRNMVNNWNIPAPVEGQGKAMTIWSSDAKDVTEEKAYFAILQNVLQNGKCQYQGCATEGYLEQNFRETYKKSSAEAKELAAKVVHPLFSSLD